MQNEILTLKCMNSMYRNRVFTIRRQSVSDALTQVHHYLTLEEKLNLPNLSAYLSKYSYQ